jgi:hypothetical protein
MVDTMGTLDDHYRQVATQAAKDEEGQLVRDYNRLVTIFNEQLDVIVARVRARLLPDDCDWVYDDDHQVASWRICKEYEDKYSYDLLAEEGVLVRTTQKDYRDFSIERRLSRPSAIRTAAEERQRAAAFMSVGDLQDLARGVMGVNFRFGVPDAQERFDRYCVDLYGRSGRCGFLSQ